MKYNKTKTLYCLFCLMFSIMSGTMKAQSVGDMLKIIPNSIIPFMNAERFNTLVYSKGVDPDSVATIRDVFENNARLTYLSDDLACIELPKVSYELIRVVSDEGDNMYCLLRTLETPERFTTGVIYNKEWMALSPTFDFADCNLVERPDTMTEKRFRELEALIEFRFIEATAMKSDPTTLTLRQSVPFTSKEEKEALQAILLQRNVKWNGKIFNICEKANEK